MANPLASSNKATLVDSFLADLEALPDNDAPLEKAGEGEDVAGLDDEMEDVDALNYDDLDSVTKLQKCARFVDIMKKVEEGLIAKGSEESMSTGIVVSEDDPEYQLFVDCNTLSVDLDNEIDIIHNFIRDKYRLKFPEWESIVLHPIVYARVVKQIGNEMDLTLVDLEGLNLSSGAIMVVCVTASTTSGQPLSDENLEKTLDACDRALALDEAKKKVREFMESCMGYFAPNLSAIVGSEVAAKLMGVAGGLHYLAKILACNVETLGAKRKNPAGFSTATAQPQLSHTLGLSFLGRLCRVHLLLCEQEPVV